MKDLVASSFEVVFTLLFQAYGRAYRGHEAQDNHEKPSPEPVFGFSIMGYCSNMVAKHV